MKSKLFLSLLLAFVLVSFVSATCTDSDGGIDIYNAGYVHYISPYADPNGPPNTGIYSYDSCGSGENGDWNLLEYYCDENETLKSVVKDCPESYRCSDRSCIPEDSTNPSGGGGSGTNTTTSFSGGGGGSSCSKYYNCADGTQIKYCSMVKEETPITCINSTAGQGPTCTAGGTKYSCKCEENPESLCPSTSPNNSSGGGSSGSSSNNTSPSGSGGGGSSSQCSTSCNLNGSCVAFGYRINNTYRDLNKNFTQQKQAGQVCENDFECSTNLCIDNKCVSSSLWQAIVKFFKRLFG